MPQKEVVELKGRYAGYTKDFDLGRGDEVTITRAGVSRQFIVLSASWFEEYGWYIEANRRDDGAYGYWKQGIDGGSVRKGWTDTISCDWCGKPIPADNIWTGPEESTICEECYATGGNSVKRQG